MLKFLVGTCLILLLADLLFKRLHGGLSLLNGPAILILSLLAGSVFYGLHQYYLAYSSGRIDGYQALRYLVCSVNPLDSTSTHRMETISIRTKADRKYYLTTNPQAIMAWYDAGCNVQVEYFLPPGSTGLSFQKEQAPIGNARVSAVPGLRVPWIGQGSPPEYMYIVRRDPTDRDKYIFGGDITQGYVFNSAGAFQILH